MVTLYIGDLVHGTVTSKWHCEVISRRGQGVVGRRNQVAGTLERVGGISRSSTVGGIIRSKHWKQEADYPSPESQYLSSLISKVINQFGVLPIFPS